MIASRPASHGSPGSRRGQALVEFAIVAFVLTLLFAGVLAFGFLIVSANVLQQAAGVAAQELARHPFTATGTFDAALQNSSLFDETQLIVDPDTDPSTLPLVNRLLFPLYTFDPDRNMVRYPGAVVTNPAGRPAVLIPIVSTNAAGGQSITQWLPVVEEITAAGQVQGPYSVAAPAAATGTLAPGMVALRINYPYQSSALIGFVRVDAGGNVVSSAEVIGTDVVNRAVIADDSSVTAVPLPTGYTLSPTTPNGSFDASVSRGDFGLGEVLAFGTEVRPYRNVIAAQGIARREVLLP